MSRKWIASSLALLIGLAVSLPSFAATPVNVNQADAATIANALDGVGMAKARAIVDYRKAHGSFKSVADLAKVKGIGPATLAHNHADIRLHGHFAQKKAAGGHARKHASH